MEIPDLIRQRLGEESIESAVSLGDEDLICFTPSRTLLYHGEGLIGDESVEEYDNNVERLNMSEGRRKTSFSLQHVDREESFSVSSDRGDAVLQRLLQSVLRTDNVLDPEETVEDVYRFSELTVIITDQQVVKHVGPYVWEDDYETYPFEDVSQLSFEEGSVATQIVITVTGRPQRFKAPNDQAKLLERSLTDALCEYYDVRSLRQLNSQLAENEPESEQDESSVSSDIELDDSINPLVGEGEEESLQEGELREIGEKPAGDRNRRKDRSENAKHGERTDSTPESGSDHAGESERSRTRSGEQSRSQAAEVDPTEIEAIQSQISKLTTAVKRQNELLKEQHDTINALIEELQRRD